MPGIVLYIDDSYLFINDKISETINRLPLRLKTEEENYKSKNKCAYFKMCNEKEEELKNFLVLFCIYLRIFVICLFKEKSPKQLSLAQ